MFEDGVEHLTVEALLLLQVFLQLDCDGIEALGGSGGVPVLAPVRGKQVVHHHCT